MVPWPCSASTAAILGEFCSRKLSENSCHAGQRDGRACTVPPPFFCNAVLNRFRRETLAATSVQRCVRGHNGRISALVEIEKLAVAKQKRMVRAAILLLGLY